MTSIPSRLSHWLRIRSFSIPSGVKCGSPSHSLTRFASGQKNSKMQGPSLCWRRNLAWQHCRLRTSCHIKYSAGAGARRRCLAKSSGACHLISSFNLLIPQPLLLPRRRRGEEISRFKSLHCEITTNRTEQKPHFESAIQYQFFNSPGQACGIVFNSCFEDP